MFGSRDLNLYAYVGNNPVDYFDNSGMTVYHCTGPVDIEGLGQLVDHHWIKTDTKEAGMGARDGESSGGEYYGVPTEVIDETGRSLTAGSSCKEVPGVDEDKVNQQLVPGRPTGRWIPPFNYCATFVDEVFDNSNYLFPEVDPFAPDATDVWGN